ncbi:endonuclease/exonuclease/phosphatase family protein [Streptomyces sp. Isolate_45]|uniref:endonuclease/exonuclease/phosphatase family protein n=1 Tax=Streptomyces sp. Isolate_45 TaxID=2950111 RepID=UPI002481A7A4|nr:endonuclease/exonuclease/phosphatase family protein [Streptomyces sp. Isolate_45]MDA5284796.1 endonuclease/exonuclease/phosphatase family protein [Streptomyces sp. Isolate_45]
MRTVTTGPGGRWNVAGRGKVLAGLCVLTALLMLLNSLIPNGPATGNLGSLVQTFLPWTGLLVPLLFAGALLRRSRPALIAVLLPALAWTGLHGPALLTDRGTGGPAELTVAAHNVDDANPDPAGAARAVAASGAQLIALEELTQPATRTYERALAATHPYHVVEGTVGLWSTFPLRDTGAVPIMPWTRALRATADTPRGPVTVYVAHLASVRLRPGGFATERRNAAARDLDAALRADPAARVLLMGDLNGTTADTALTPLMSRFRSVQEEAGTGLGFSWPARFPVARIDQILVRGLSPVSAWTLPPTASDHLPVAASVRF